MAACTMCNGSGKVICPKCNGTGQIDDGSGGGATCFMCNGDGRSLVPALRRQRHGALRDYGPIATADGEPRPADSISMGAVRPGR